MKIEKELPVGTVVKLRRRGASKSSTAAYLVTLLILVGVLAFIAFYLHSN